MIGCPACEASASGIPARACFTLGFTLGTLGIRMLQIDTPGGMTVDQTMALLLEAFCEDCNTFLRAHAARSMSTTVLEEFKRAVEARRAAESKAET